MVCRGDSFSLREKVHDVTVDAQAVVKDPQRLFPVPCDKEVPRLLVARSIQLKSVSHEIQGAQPIRGCGYLQWIPLTEVKECLPRIKSLRPALPFLGSDLTKFSVNPGFFFIDEFFYGCCRKIKRRPNHDGAIVFDGHGQRFSSLLRSNDSAGQWTIHHIKVRPSFLPSPSPSRPAGTGRNAISPRTERTAFGVDDE